MQRILQTIRYREWYDSKWNCYLTVFLLYCLRHEDFDRHFYLKGVLAVMSFTFFLLAFGYAFNDYSDAIEDRLAGKGNQISHFSKRQQIVILCGLVMAGILIPRLLFPSFGVFLAVLISFAVAFLYSYRTLGIKRKNILGLVVSSLAQRVCPLSLIFILFQDWSATSLLVASWAFLVGLRWILIHQAFDFENDRKTDTNTYVTRQNNETRLLTQITGVFVAELLCVAAILLMNFSLSWALLIPAAYLIFQATLISYWRKLGWKRLILSYDFAPLADFYYLWAGLLVVTALLHQQLTWAIMFIPTLYFGYRYLVLDLKYLKLKHDAKRGMPAITEGASTLS